MSPVSGQEMMIEMLKQTNSTIMSFREEVSARFEKFEDRQNKIHEIFVTRSEFATTNERILDDMANLVNQFKLVADKLSDNKQTQNEIVVELHLIKERVKELENENKEIKAEQKERKNHRRNVLIATIGSLTLVIFEFVKDQFFK